MLVPEKVCRGHHCATGRPKECAFFALISTLQAKPLISSTDRGCSSPPQLSSFQSSRLPAQHTDFCEQGASTSGSELTHPLHPYQQSRPRLNHTEPWEGAMGRGQRLVSGMPTICPTSLMTSGNEACGLVFPRQSHTRHSLQPPLC